MKVFFATVVALVLTGHAAAAPPSQRFLSGGVKGDIVEADMAKYVVLDPQISRRQVASAERCASFCSSVPNCNAWTYCDAAGGCGGLKAGACVLKAVADTAKAEVSESAAGLKSGVFTAALPARCSGLAWTACSACLGTPNPDACIACARKTEASGPLIAFGVAADVWAACAVCWSRSKQPEACQAALLSKSAADNGCALAGVHDPSWDVDTCIGCTQKYGALFAEDCRSCTRLSKDSTKLSACFTCIDKSRANRCKPDYANPNRFLSSPVGKKCSDVDFIGDGDCASCARVESKELRELCTICMSEAGRDVATCNACVSLASDVPESKRTMCLRCALADKPGSVACAKCLLYSGHGAAAQQECLDKAGIQFRIK